MLYGATIVVFHEFHKPPYGGGNQFLLALKEQFESLGLRVGANRVGKNTKACLFNSFNFDFGRLRRAARTQKVRLVHRVDGPIGVYRGADDGTDRRIWTINHELAEATIFQSQYSLQKHLELGFEFRNPTVIPNSVNPQIFHKLGRVAPPAGTRKVRIIASSWSDNPRKGGPVYKWLEEHLDWDRYEFTFVGRSPVEFQKIRHVPACPSQELAGLLRKHDIYLTASQDDPCSNALIEALACGLPAVFLESGGHPELVGAAGAAFSTQEEALLAIDKIAANYSRFQGQIKVKPMSEVARLYLEVLLGQPG